MYESRIRLLVLYANYSAHLSYFDDWLDALREYPSFETVAVDIVSPDAKGKVKNALGEVDAAVLLHSTNGDYTAHLERHVPALVTRHVPLVIFVGNEVNLPGKPLAEKRRVFSQIRPEWVATQLVEEAGQFLFGDLVSRSVVSLPHALNPSIFSPRVDASRRPVDIGTRVMRYPPHIGDNDRNRIAEGFINLSRGRGLAVDISNQRHNRAGWAEFLNHCKGTVATEAGSWFLERDDTTVNAIRDFMRDQVRGIEIAEDSLVMNLGYQLPAPLRRVVSKFYRALGGRFEYQSVAEEPLSYEDIYARFFAGKPRAPVYSKCISSRHFDAIGTKTCQIMFRGRFNDILKADTHYLVLDDDFSNFDEVLRRFTDLSERRGIVDAAYAHVRESHTYEHRMGQLDVLFRSK